ncbi:MAG: phosphopyruvate hydratase [Clostridia bacterium]|nr:phosphopyruvate hydratase [Clostridia bacterium]
MITNKKISALRAFEILDSRGIPSVSVHVFLENGACGSASVPSGASTGSNEAHERRDGDAARYGGKGTLAVCRDIEKKILPAVKGMDAGNQTRLDETLIALDGSENKENLGANALLAVSLAAARACANAYGLPLCRYLGGSYGTSGKPIPMMNILNGGRHAGNNVDIQEFMIVPIHAESSAQAVRIGSEIYHTLKELLKKRGLSVSVGDEGGFAPNLNRDEDALDFLTEAIEAAGYRTEDVKIALDAAASEWERNGNYVLPKRGTEATADGLIRYYETLCANYPILSLEDPVGEHDHAGWEKITKMLGNHTMLVGDDLFVTNPKLLQEGIRDGLANAVLIKPNQIGTLTETMLTVRIAKENGYRAILSHRSGETCDSFISDLAVAVGAQFLKAGAPARGERVAKYNRLIKIEKAFDFYD